MLGPPKTAHACVQYAIKDGFLPHPSTIECETGCGRVAQHYHHHVSYEPTYWLHVTPLCQKCHSRIHFGRIPEPATGELRRGERKRAGAKWSHSPDWYLFEVRAGRTPKRSLHPERWAWAVAWYAADPYPEHDGWERTKGGSQPTPALRAWYARIPRSWEAALKP